MERPYIESLRIADYGCVKDATLRLSPLHALIGPNDSGKSTILTALRMLTTVAAGPLEAADDRGKLEGAIATNPQFRFEATAGGEAWLLRHEQGTLREELHPTSSQVSNGVILTNYGSQLLRGTKLRDALAGSRLLRLEPDALRQSTPLIQQGQALGFANALGLGLPAVYDAIISRDFQAFISITQQLCSLFPTVKQLSLKNPTPTSRAKQNRSVSSTRAVP